MSYSEPVDLVAIVTRQMKALRIRVESIDQMQSGSMAAGEAFRISIEFAAVTEDMEAVKRFAWALWDDANTIR